MTTTVGGTLTLGIISNHLHFTAGVGASGIFTWVIDGTETTRQRRLTVTAQKEDSSLMVLQADATDLYDVNRLVLARTSSTDGRWRVVAYTPTANTVLQTNVVIGADQEIIWEPVQHEVADLDRRHACWRGRQGRLRHGVRRCPDRDRCWLLQHHVLRQHPTRRQCLRSVKCVAARV